MGVSSELRQDGYKPSIGIECHVQFKTLSKLFAAVDNDARHAEPNTLVSHICLGLPGALPVLNIGAVSLAIRAALALGTKPQNMSQFDRKHYFYPDLPFGYQITQFYHPIILGGKVDYLHEGVKKTVKIHEAHLESDAGKSTHPAGKDYSLVDLNRAGTPLLEIVSEPDMHSAGEARAYAHELYLLMSYAEVSDCSLFYGNMRFDVNVSVSKSSKLGTRTETKNLNSFKSVEKAAAHEISRQIGLLEKGQKITQETRGWDDTKQKTFSQRGKEDAHDYRYMPDPDIPPIVLNDSFVSEVANSMPMGLSDIRAKLVAAGIAQNLLDSVLDNSCVTYAIINLSKIDDTPQEVLKVATQWLAQMVTKIASDNILDTEDLHLNLKSIVQIAKMYTLDKLSSTAAKGVFEAVVLKDVDPSVYAAEKGLMQVSDESAIIQIVQAVLADNAKAAADVAAGESKAIAFLVGQVMKASKGSANPAKAKELIKKELKV